jgi:hypothetical protein
VDLSHPARVSWRQCRGIRAFFRFMPGSWSFSCRGKPSNRFYGLRALGEASYGRTLPGVSWPHVARFSHGSGWLVRPGCILHGHDRPGS